MKGNEIIMSKQRWGFLVGSIAFFFFQLSPTLEAQGNLLTNPGFEDPFDANSRWTTNPPAILERSQTSPRSGSWAGRVFDRTQQWHGGRYGLLADSLLVDGETYQFGMWVRVDNPSDQALRLNLTINDDREVCPTTLAPGIEWCSCFDLGGGDFSCIYGLDNGLSNSSTWIQLGWEGKINFVGSPAFAQLYVDTPGGDPLSDIYLDDASLINSMAIFGDGFESGNTSAW